ncbi:MAG TPA: ATP-binding protein [Verrucomicrobiae bacterium]|jgi:light-regulated signal transduction histidine kinase (bacteriophytochrome)
MSAETIESLRAERDRLAAELAERSAQLEAVSHEFELFTQALSHDLRAPLRAVEGFAQILVEDYGDKFEGDGRRCIDTLTAGARNASALIEDLHSFSRLSRRPYRPAVIDMRHLAGQKAEQLTAAGASAKFSIDPLPCAWGDPDLLGAVMEELLGNAVKFSRRHKQPAIEVRGASEQARTVYSVRDNGVGFEPKYADRLFGVFQRLHDHKDFEGRGIGLATVQRLVHRHGGEVWAEGKTNGGAVFSFSLPLRPL